MDDVRGELGVGQSWVDVTTPGLKPRMETTAYEPGRLWTERGTWGRYSAELTLRFEPDGAGCQVTPTVRLEGPLAFVLRALAPAAIRSDLGRAARALGRRG